MNTRRLRAAVGGKVRLEKLEGREYLVAPVIALVEGVIQASNSAQPELVLAEEFGRLPQSWNGRFVMFNHPEISGEKTSANSPGVVNALRLGTVFNARVEEKKLKMEAWIEVEKVSAVGEEAVKLVNAVRKGQTVEVSVGVFVQTEAKKGVHAASGKAYAAVWRDIMPDHLALLPEGIIGACSVEMGCGTRAARAASAGGGMKPTLEELRTRFKNRYAADEGASDRDLRMALEAALFASEPGFLGVVDVFGEAKQVVYAAIQDVEGEPRFFRMSFEVGDGGAVTLGGSPEEVKQVTKYEAAAAAARAATCGCGGSAKTTHPTEKTPMADKARVAALLVKLAAKHPTLYKAEDAPIYEAMSEARIKALEEAADKPAEEPKPAAAVPAVAAPVVAAPAAPVVAPTAPLETQEAFLSRNPDLNKIVSEHKAAASAKKTLLVGKLKACQTAFSETELVAMDVDHLEKLAAAVSKPVADFAPNAPRHAAQPEGTVKEGAPKPPNMKERLLAAQARGAAPKAAGN